ncbi:MAG: bifunctional 3-(3-hydroxy-phenyl)propionate/3-hydroxycinnamic acid hydroxylase [Deltaproteobacteria bacterium]|nr:bifunctional 3-(3-hydroxy-phenyl)propionate/3-hydroxycinnamic acid hydroxylase [Deltaproteobacteria bacterium]
MIDVAIVGGGPVGLTLANLLGTYGIATLLLERNPTTVDEPRAIAIDAESLRTMQAVDLYDAVAPDLLIGFAVDYVNGRGTPMMHVELGQTPYGHAQQNSFDQPLLERVLAAGLQRFPHVTTRFAHALESFEAGPGGVALRGRGPDGAPFTAEARYLIGCDGGRSLVRQQLGIEMRGRTAPQRWLVIDTIDPLLADTMACRFFCDPRRPGMTLRKQHQKRRWEWMLMPGEQDADLLDDGMIARLIAPYTRPPQVRIERKCVYTFHSLVADRYRDGRVLLAGDAAHMMPPFAGQGMNGGIRDAANLAWKLAAVVRGQADEALLDTYQEERRAHVMAATALADRLGAMIQPTSRWRAALRDLFFFAVNRSPRGQAMLDRQLLGTLRAPRLRRGVFVGAADADGARLSGQMIVQPPLRAPDGRIVALDSLLGHWFAVLGCGADPRRALDAAARDACQALGARLVHVVPRGSVAPEGALEDHTGALAAWFGDTPERFVLLRPDRFCAAQFGAATAAARLAQVRQLMHGAAPAGPAPQRIPA